MPVQDSLSIVRNIYDSYNRRDFENAVKNLDPNFELRNVPVNITLRGQDGLRQFMQDWDRAFPDSRCEIKNLEGSDNFVVCEFHGIGTHKGILKTPGGDIQPTGKRVDVSFCDVYNIKNGKIVKQSSYYDLATFMKQLGILTDQKLHA